MHLATIYSYPVTRNDTNTSGIYEMEVEIDEMELRFAPHKKESAALLIAEYAQKMARTTGLPLNQGLYYAVVDKTIADSIGLPQRFDI